MPQAGVAPSVPATLPVAPHSVTRRATFEADSDAFMGAWVGHRTDLMAQAASAFDNANRGSANASEAAVSATVAGVSQAASEAAKLDAQLAAGQALNAPGTQATSVSMQTLAPGAMTLTVQTGKAFTPGQFVVVAATAALGNAGFGQVASYVSGTGVLVVQVATFVGVSASYSAWSVTAGGQNQLAAALAQLPNLEPTLVMDFVRGAVPSAINAAGGACRLLGRNQQYRDAAANSAEVDFDVATARCRGLLVEGARSFVALWSTDQTNAVWVNLQVAGATLAVPTFRGEPLFTLAKTTTGTSAQRRQSLPDVAAGDSLVTTFVVQGGTSARLEFCLYSANATDAGTNGDSQAVVLSGPGALTRLTGASWTVTGLSAAEPTLIRLRRHFPTAATVVSINFYPDLSTSTTNGASVLIGRVAVERGTGAILEHSSYVRTAGAAVLRAADVYTVTGADFGDFWNPDQGTIVVSFTPGASSDSATAIRMDDGTFDGRFYVFVTAAGGVFVQNYVANVQQANGQLGAGLNNSRVCVAVSFKNGAFWGSVNGGAVVNLGAGVLGPKSRLTLGSSAGSAHLDGPLQAVVYYPRAVTALECAALSNYWRAS